MNALSGRRSRVPAGLLAAVAGVCLASPTARGDLWTTGYYPGWEQSSWPASNIDFSVLTHVIHFAVVPKSNGTLDTSYNSISASRSSDLVSNAHAAGRKALICVGGPDTSDAFRSATTNDNLAAFVGNLTNLVASRGYDGVDVDWEPLFDSDSGQFADFITGLRVALNHLSPDKLLTVASHAYPPYGDPPMAQYAAFAAIQTNFDQINVMTYDLSGPYPGWVTWFNSPIYDGGYRFDSTGGLVPSVDGAIENFITNGVLPGKLGVGIPFYGYIWQGGNVTDTEGVSWPRQSWTNAPTVFFAPYKTILSTYYQTNLYHWDEEAQAAYLSVEDSLPENDMFIAYDDPRSCQCKVSYARNHGLGGVMIWQIAQDDTDGETNTLLGAIKDALAAPGKLDIKHLGDSAELGFRGVALGAYRVQWTENLIAGPWNTLIVTNTPGPSSLLRIEDSVSPSTAQRFYRVQTPP